jgi:hypothetical protein
MFKYFGYLKHLSERLYGSSDAKWLIFGAKISIINTECSLFANPVHNGLGNYHRFLDKDTEILRVYELRINRNYHSIMVGLPVSCLPFNTQLLNKMNFNS